MRGAAVNGADGRLCIQPAPHTNMHTGAEQPSAPEPGIGPQQQGGWRLPPADHLLQLWLPPQCLQKLAVPLQMANRFDK